MARAEETVHKFTDDSVAVVRRAKQIFAPRALQDFHDVLEAIERRPYPNPDRPVGIVHLPPEMFGSQHDYALDFGPGIVAYRIFRDYPRVRLLEVIRLVDEHPPAPTVT